MPSHIFCQIIAKSITKFRKLYVNLFLLVPSEASKLKSINDNDPIISVEDPQEVHFNIRPNLTKSEEIWSRMKIAWQETLLLTVIFCKRE